MEAKKLEAVRSYLIERYHREARDLPWRRTNDAYCIWVSEIMLQQTQVATVVPRYLRFIERFPTIEALANALEEEVLSEWAGLGYYRRARMLHQGAGFVQREFGGALPRSVAELERVPGIGRYTAGAIASIAFGVPAPIVDGNVIRVMCRIEGWDGDPTKRSLKKEIWANAAELAEHEAPGTINQAIMEFGATVCTPQGSAKCGVCDLSSSHCLAFQQGRVTELPRKVTRAKKRRVNLSYALIRNGREVLCWRRPAESLWGGLIEPLSCEGQQAEDLAERWGLDSDLRSMGSVHHTLTHREVYANVYEGSGVGSALEHGAFWAIPENEGVSALAQKVLALKA